MVTPWRHMSEETKRKISLAMKKRSDSIQISIELKRIIITKSIIQFLNETQNFTSQTDWIVYINKHKELVDEDNNDSTRDISIYDYMKRLDK